MDKNANYSTLDIIKTQLASVHFKQLYYKTNTIEDKDILRGMSWINYQSFFKFKRLEKVLTDKEIENNNRLNDSLRKLGELNVIPPPPPPMPNWYFDNLHKIYSDNQEAIDEALEEQSYTCTLLTNEGFMTDTDIVTMENTEKLQELFSSFNIVFVKFDKDLIYSNYFKAIKAFKEIDTTNRGFLVELSNEIVEIHKTSEINLCN
ncbi:hypothetical protein [Winogradskyella luteola]|uniref:Uncharacterized protein n=1 Tax=Winogradskyella luteola TaxID=2828330 RepID=A0A9X1FB19_9FLAO|nr:hypothetical protein [Winogradskyella luteola]MBV7269345.1 hypothetical protein [Winogradskyella luteola]